MMRTIGTSTPRTSLKAKKQLGTLNISERESPWVRPRLRMRVKLTKLCWKRTPTKAEAIAQVPQRLLPSDDEE